MPFNSDLTGSANLPDIGYAMAARDTRAVRCQSIRRWVFPGLCSPIPARRPSSQDTMLCASARGGKAAIRDSFRHVRAGRRCCNCSRSVRLDPSYRTSSFSSIGVQDGLCPHHCSTDGWFGQAPGVRFCVLKRMKGCAIRAGLAMQLGDSFDLIQRPPRSLEPICMRVYARLKAAPRCGKIVPCLGHNWRARSTVNQVHWSMQAGEGKWSCHS
jgi:hypothetical protein